MPELFSLLANSRHCRCCQRRGENTFFICPVGSLSLGTWESVGIYHQGNSFLLLKHNGSQVPRRQKSYKRPLSKSSSFDSQCMRRLCDVAASLNFWGAGSVTEPQNRCAFSPMPTRQAGTPGRIPLSIQGAIPQSQQAGPVPPLM